jgi:CHAT domain-containing protein/tetratricopeptide (TPR) repeat protein
MDNEFDLQSFMRSFFEAVELRHLDRCSALLAELDVLAQHRPDLAAWSAYFTGVLANEHQRDWAEAERIFAHLLRTELDPPLRGRVLLASGRTFDYQGRWAEAIDAYQQALPIFAGLDRPVDQAKVWKQIAIAYHRGASQGDFGAEALERAAAYCRQALAALDALADPELEWLVGSVWNTLGLVSRELGQWQAALDCYRRDFAICQALDDQHGMGVSLLNMGEIQQQLGREHWPDARRSFEQALELLRAFDDHYLEADTLANIAFLHQTAGDTGVALAAYEHAIRLIESLRAGNSSEDARAGFFATSVDTYANAVLLCLECGDVAGAFNYVERARSRAFLDLLATRAAEPPGDSPTLTLADVQAALPDGALLLEYFTTGEFAARARPGTHHPQRHRFPPAATLLFVVTREEAAAYNLGLSPNTLAPRLLEGAVERHFLSPAIRRSLYTRLLGPAEHQLDQASRVYLIPHGPLHYVPFQALTAPAGHPLLHPGGPQLVHAPSASVLFGRAPVPPPGPREPSLSLGYNGTGATRLRFGEEEARRIAQITGGHALVGPAPKKQLLARLGGRYQYLHISCHGAFAPDAPLESSLSIAADEQLTAGDVLSELRLHCDLVTLSACESGLSRVRRGDELMGLARAFLSAGAPALVCTLWQVDERSTCLLMARFYQEVQHGHGFAEALKQAQLYLVGLTREQARHALVELLASTVLPTASGHSEASPQEAAHAYLKGLRPKRTDPVVVPVEAVSDEEHPFADPYYWAPFVLISSYGAGG